MARNVVDLIHVENGNVNAEGLVVARCCRQLAHLCRCTTTTPMSKVVANIFCKTGLGGGIKPDCKASETGGVGGSSGSGGRKKKEQVATGYEHLSGKALTDKRYQLEQSIRQESSAAEGGGLRADVARANRRTLQIELTKVEIQFAREHGRKVEEKQALKTLKHLVANIFCPTGQGGGIDPGCLAGGSHGPSRSLIPRTSRMATTFDDQASQHMDPGVAKQSVAAIKEGVNTVLADPRARKFLEDAGVLQDGKLHVTIASALDPTLQKRGLIGTEGGFADDRHVTLLAKNGLTAQEAAHILIHEAAHKWSDKHGMDDSLEITYATYADTKGMSQMDKMRWGYVATPGSNEPFVEAVAQQFSSYGRSFQTTAERFKQHYPKSIELAKRKLAERDL